MHHLIKFIIAVVAGLFYIEEARVLFAADHLLMGCVMAIFVIISCAAASVSLHDATKSFMES